MLTTAPMIDPRNRPPFQSRSYFLVQRSGSENSAAFWSHLSDTRSRAVRFIRAREARLCGVSEADEHDDMDERTEDSPVLRLDQDATSDINPAHKVGRLRREELIDRLLGAGPGAVVIQNQDATRHQPIEQRLQLRLR